MRVYFNLLHLINMLNTDLTCMLSLRPSGVYKTQSFVCIYIYITKENKWFFDGAYSDSI
jgi:hypothetical protein